MIPESTYRPPANHRGYPCPKCRRLAFEFYGLGDDALCAACRNKADDR